MACITEIIGAGNPEHFFVATQDADLRKKFQEVCVCFLFIVMGTLDVLHGGFYDV